MNKKQKQGIDATKFNADLLLDNSPIVSVDEYGDETEILLHKIKANGVKNIAVVASFGAGKSSAIETYLQTHRPKKRRIFRLKKTKPNDTYTRISLASFNDTEYKDSDIERSILQQLLYSQPKRKLPNSRIERTTITPKKWTMFFAFTLLTFFAASLLFSLQMGKVFLHEATELNNSLNWVFFSLSGASFFVLTWVVLHFRKLSRIQYKDFELDIKQKDDVKTHSGQSLINKFIDEVLYFFESTKIDLVIFEDLDRLEYKKEEVVKDENGKPKINTTIADRSSAILVKLRELNTLINNSQQCERKITFLYAIKDDTIKKQEERAKFFEFILPIVPILNPITKANKMREAHERLIREELKIRGAKELDYNNLTDSKLKLDSEFISEISSYVPNMRTLKNAFNEYVISHGRIFKSTAKGRLQNENLFALSLYKNLYPYDYAQLEQATGIIPIVMNKSHLVTDEVKASNDRIKELQELLKKSDDEHLKDFVELRALFKAQVPGITQMIISGQWVQIDVLSTFNGIELGKTQYQYLRPNYGNYSGILPANITLPNGDSFFEREKILLAKTKAGKEQIAQSIEKEKQNIAKYETMTLYELIRLKGVDFHFKAAGNKETTKAYLAELRNVAVDNEEENRLRTFSKDSKQLGYLKFLLQNNYIDEKYMEYTSGYESKILSSFDEEFIFKVKQGEQDFHHRIDNPGKVIDQIRESSFAEPAILNNTILLNLQTIKAQEKNNKYSNIKKLLNKEIAKEPIKAFIQNNDEKKVVEFLKHIIDGNENIVGRLLSDTELSNAKKDLAIQALIENVNDYTAHNVDGQLSLYMDKADNYEDILGRVDLAKAKAFLNQVKPKIETLQNTENKITQFAIENNMYQINIGNLEKVLVVASSDSDFYKKNYDFISKNEKVKAYVDANLNEYVKNVFISDELVNSEEENVLSIKFLKSTDIELAQKIAIISKYDFKLNIMGEFQNDLYTALLQFNRVYPSWGNIKTACVYGGFSEDVKEFVSKNAQNIDGNFKDSPLGVKDISPEMLSYLNNGLFIDLANAKYSDNSILEMIAVKIEKVVTLTNEYENDENLALLIKNGMISYNATDFSLLADKPESLKAYVVRYKDKLSTGADVNTFFAKVDAAILRVLLFSREVDKELQQKLISAFGNKIVVDSFEQEYFNAIKDRNLKMPTSLFFKFANSNLSKSDKQDLVILVYDSGDNIKLFKEALIAIMPKLGSNDGEIKIEMDNEKDESFLRTFADIAKRSFSRRKNRVTLKTIIK